METHGLLEPCDLDQDLLIEPAQHSLITSTGNATFMISNYICILLLKTILAPVMCQVERECLTPPTDSHWVIVQRGCSELDQCSGTCSAWLVSWQEADFRLREP